MKVAHHCLRLILALLIVFINLIFSFTISHAAADNPAYAELLNKYVADGWVDYKGFKSKENMLDQYLLALEQIQIKDLSFSQKKAFYINAYNAWTIKLILSAYPEVKSIKDLGSIFKSPCKNKIVRIEGKTLTLDHIEHDILRPKFKDPRVHFAVNCASKSCPPLRPQPYDGDTLNEQLDEMTTAFINDPKSNHMDGNRLYVSAIFKWFAEDFNHDIVDFFLKYARGSLKTELEDKKDRIKIKYLDYDWSLNGS
jgi:hypothetical protein